MRRNCVAALPSGPPRGLRLRLVGGWLAILPDVPCGMV